MNTYQNTYQWEISEYPEGGVALFAHNILVKNFTTEEEALQYINHVVRRDTVEKRARRWSERALRRWAAQWSQEFNLPLAEVLEDVIAGMSAMLIDLVPEGEDTHAQVPLRNSPG